jgi:hypothetical protein
MATLQTERKQLSDPLLRKMLGSSARHKVVAYPNAEQRRLQQNSTLSTKSSDAILGDNAFGIQVPVLKPVSLRPRSLSTGRQRRKRDDLVQSVYDRLGVTRGARLADVAPEVVPAVPHQRAKKSTERGRNRESVSEPEVPSSSRPRSLSRDGRLRPMWPPTPASSTAQIISTDAPVSVPPTTGKSNRNDEGLNQETRSSKTSSQTSEAAPLYSPTRRMVRSPEEAAEILSPKPQYRLSGDKEVLKTRVYRNTATPKSDWRDEKKEADCISPDLDDSPLVNGPTVKDRMRAFIIPEAPKPVPKKTNAKEYPPLIDIYADERNHETYQPDAKNEEDSVGMQSKKSLQRNNGGKQDPATDTVGPHIPNRVAAGKSSGNQLASSFLAAINTSPEKSTTPRTFVYNTAAATVEFPGSGGGGDDQGSATGTVSVSMLSSSASDDQLSPTHATRFFATNPTSVITSHTTTGPIRKSHWLEKRNKLLAASEKAPVTSSSSSTPVMPSLRTVTTASTSTNEQLSAAAAASANIERMVDERVKARLFELERRVEEQMRTFLQRMDEKITARIADMDRNR